MDIGGLAGLCWLHQPGTGHRGSGGRYINHGGRSFQHNGFFYNGFFYNGALDNGAPCYGAARDDGRDNDHRIAAR